LLKADQRQEEPAACQRTTRKPVLVSKHTKVGSKIDRNILRTEGKCGDCTKGENSEILRRNALK
jgi:hypothetical protein